MSSDRGLKFDTLLEADLEPVLALFQGADPDETARRFGIDKERLVRMRDDLAAQMQQERSAATKAPARKIGRNAPCPCGSGKKYKHCCMQRRTMPQPAEAHGGESSALQAKLIQAIEEAFELLRCGRYALAIDRAGAWLTRCPDEDRLHDIVMSAHLYDGRFETAIEICRQRLAVSESEKAYFVEHGRYRDSDIETPALSYCYPPLTWRQKYWIALKAREYQAVVPEKEDTRIPGLVQTLRTVDDVDRYPARHQQGLELRRQGVKETLAALASTGPQVVPYLLPLAVRYTWSGLFVPEILAAYPSDLATRALIDISMFGFSYASGASLHFLAERGEAAIAAIRDAFGRDREFDPIKTGIVSVLGNIRTAAAYGVLMTLLDNESPHIVNWAGDALGKFDRLEALPAMVRASDRIGGEQMIENAILHLKDRAIRG